MPYASTSDQQDRLEITDVIYRYAASIDRFDFDRVRSTVADDIVAQFGNEEVMHGGDTFVAWIEESTKDCIWQHHLLSVYSVDIDGDHAKALVYHTSYQMFGERPDVVGMLVARYHDELVRTDQGWRISKIVFELLWGEQRSDTAGYLASVGGRGPEFPRPPRA